MPVYLDITNAPALRLVFKNTSIVLVEGRHVVKIGENPDLKAPAFLDPASIIGE